MELSAGYRLGDCDAQRTDHYLQAKRELTRRWLVKYAKAGMTLLNIGCGAGEFHQIAQDLGLKVVACEPDPAAFAIAREAAPPGCTVYNCDLRGLAQLGMKGDFIILHDVLEHIEGDAEAVALVHSLVNSGGHVLVSVPAFQWLFGRHDEELGHYRRYTIRSLARVLAPYFHIRRMRYYGAALIPGVLVFSRILRRDYPRRTLREGFIGRMYAAICNLEISLALPTGISIVADVTPK